MTRRILILLASMLLVTLALVFGVNHFFLAVHLTGDPQIILEYGQRYEEPGAWADLRGTWIHRQGIPLKNLDLVISGEVDPDILGQQTIRYSAGWLWFRGEGTRTVTIVDTQSPVITLAEDPEGSLEPGLIYKEAGFSAWDNFDGDITDKVIRREFQGRITYAVTDSSGNPAYAERNVPFHDPIAPEIILNGGAYYPVQTGRPYLEPGFTATDNVDGDLTAQVIAEGTVDPLHPGEYPITYTVTDAYGNTAAVTRTVHVTAAERVKTRWPENKTIYLTFDDGPGPDTEKLLDILDIYGVKATFFVTNSEYSHMIREIAARGHSIGIHSVTHTYEEIYASPEAYFQDLYQMQQIIYEHTGILTTLMRFPGGSSNMVSRRTCEGIMTYLTEAVQDAGFQYFDWNVDSDDAGNAHKTETVVENIKTGVEETGIALVLQHDVYPYSINAVMDILQWGQENGYRFLPLEGSSPGFHHPLNN